MSQVLAVRLRLRCAFLCYRSSEAGGSRAVSGLLYNLEGDGGGGTRGLYECGAYRTQLKNPDLKVCRMDRKMYILCLSDDLNKCFAIFLQTLVTLKSVLTFKLLLFNLCVSENKTPAK